MKAKRHLLLWSIFLSSSLSLCAQLDQLQFSSATVEITGTSSLHDWTVAATEISNHPTELTVSSSGEIEAFTFAVGVSSMDGGRGTAMNNKIYKALKETTHPQVIFNQMSPLVLDQNQLEESHNIKGSLTIAGVTREYEMQVKTLLDDGQLSISTAHSLLFSDFDIVPPSAMFGQIKTGDEVTVSMTFTYQSHE